jgi:SAM-dependent methyltransferase
MITDELQVAFMDRLTRPVEVAGLTERRRRLLVEARGRVLDVGAGTGTNLPHYRNVDEVVALETTPAMARRLSGRLRDAVVPVSVVESDLDDALLEDGSFDTVVCTLVLCTVPDIDHALQRIHSLLRPDGVLLFLEHVRVTGMWGRVQHMATPLWKNMALGCHLDRDPLGSMRANGFVVTDCEHFTMPLIHAKVGTAAQGVAQLSRREESRR